MASAPTITYLQLDASYDPIFDPAANLADLDAVTQAIETRLNLWLGEWWENLNLGLPVMQNIVGQLGSPQGLVAMELAVQQNIEGAPYVTSVPSVGASFVDGRLSLSYKAFTQFGPVSSTVTAPALANASLAG